MRAVSRIRQRFDDFRNPYFGRFVIGTVRQDWAKCHLLGDILKHWALFKDFNYYCASFTLNLHFTFFALTHTVFS